MAQYTGKQKWRREPEFDRQFQERRSHITCPKCNASLGDAWEEKGQRKYQYYRNFARQFLDDRRYITCPKCSLLLGEVVWMPPTRGDWARYFFTESWKGSACIAITLGVGVGAAFLLASFMHNPSLVFRDTMLRVILTVAFATQTAAWSFGFFYLFLACEIGSSEKEDGWDDWWWYNW